MPQAIIPARQPLPSPADKSTDTPACQKKPLLAPCVQPHFHLPDAPCLYANRTPAASMQIYRVGDPFTHRKAFSAAASPALPSITASLSVWTNAKTFHCVKAPTAKSTLPQKCSFPIIPYIQSSRSRF